MMLTVCMSDCSENVTISKSSKANDLLRKTVLISEKCLDFNLKGQISNI